jgi:hypothetical protein
MVTPGSVSGMDSRLRGNDDFSTNEHEMHPGIDAENDVLRRAEAAALAWVARGMPDDEIVYDDQAPRTTGADWKDAETVCVKFTGAR